MSHWTDASRYNISMVYNYGSWHQYRYPQIRTTRTQTTTTIPYIVQPWGNRVYYIDTAYSYRHHGIAGVKAHPTNQPENTFWGTTAISSLAPSDTCLRQAQQRLKDSTLNTYMAAKDLIDGVGMCTNWFRGLASVYGDLKKRNLVRAYRRLITSNALSNGSKKAQRKVARRLGNLQRYFYKKKRTARAEKKLSSAWLEFQWGVKPTLDTITKLLKNASDYQPTLRITSHARDSYNWTQGDGFGGYWDCQMEGSVTCIRKMRLSTLSFAASWGLTNPVKAVWDGIPWSFLVDWFIPVSTYLDSIFTFPVWSAEGSDVRKSTTTQQHRNGPSIYYKVDDDIPCGPLDCYNRSRSIYLGIQNYTVSQMLRDSSFGLSGSRALNAFALFVQKTHFR